MEEILKYLVKEIGKFQRTFKVTRDINLCFMKLDIPISQHYFKLPRCTFFFLLLKKYSLG